MRLPVLTLAFCLMINFLPAQSGSWIWMKGTQAYNGTGVFGTRGLASATNMPPAVYDASTWVDRDGNFWLFGGCDNSLNAINAYSDMWKFDPLTNMWTWMNGPGLTGQPGQWGIKGVSSPANYPSTRTYGSFTWTDMDNNLWLYGGEGRDVNIGQGALSDLWKYDITTNEWTWVNGDNDGIRDTAVCGILGQFNPANTPGGRMASHAAWVDNNNDLWLFGGMNYKFSNGAPHNMLAHDLWRYDIAADEWAWMKGEQLDYDNLPTAGGSYGALGVEVMNNLPAARSSSCTWKNSAGDFYMSDGGWGDGYNDVWKYNTLTNNWTWIAGDSGLNKPGLYSQYCVDNGAIGPAARQSASYAANGNCINGFFSFGGSNQPEIGGASGPTRNDLWFFNAQTNTYKWLSGSSQLNQAGNYGALGVAASSNMPPSRACACMWLDNTGALWVFGGTHNYQSTNLGDMWKYIPDTTCVPLGLFSGDGKLPYSLSSNTVCGGDSVDLTLFGILNMQISPANSTLQTDSSHVLLFPSSTTTYRLTGVTPCHNPDTAYFTIAYTTLQETITSDANVICATDSATICTGQQWQSYHWSNGDTSACIATSLAGNYYVTVTDNNGCTAESNHTAIQVFPASSVSISVTGDTLRAFNAVSCQWYLNGNPIPGATAGSYVATQPGLYTVQVTDDNGCIATTLPVLISGVNELSAASISVYPNPSANGSWMLSTPGSTTGMAEVLDVTGRKIFEAKIAGTYTPLSFDATAGIYFLQLKLNKGQYTLRLIRL